MNEIERRRDAGLPSDPVEQRALRRAWESGLLPDVTPTLLSGLLTVDMNVSAPVERPALQLARPIMGHNVELAIA
ncbi:MAG: hypothetical protein ACREGB_00825 [Candidatus Saccharimonadales bacterium]